MSRALSVTGITNRLTKIKIKLVRSVPPGKKKKKILSTTQGSENTAVLDIFKENNAGDS